MTIKGFVEKAAADLAGLYGRREAVAMAVRLLEEWAGTRSYTHLTEPEREISGWLRCRREAFPVSESGSGRPEASCSGGVRVPEEEAGTGIPERWKTMCPEEAESALLQALEMLCTGRPLQYVLGYAEFSGLRLRVGEGVLIPRPETEELVRLIVSDLAGKEFSGNEESGESRPGTGRPGGCGAEERILDLCTGSGCIAYALAAARPQARVYGCDFSREALSVARNQPAGRRLPVVFFSCDVLGADAAGILAEYEPEWDVMVSNPPYVCESERAAMRKNVLEFEPPEALFVPDENPLLFYEAVSELARRCLRPGGRLYFEINERFGEQTARLLREQGFGSVRVKRDLNGKFRMVSAVRPDR